MKPYLFDSFTQVIEQAGYQLQFRSKIVHSDRWQGSYIKNNPEMATHEVCHLSFVTGLPTEELDPYRKEIKPNLPWADNHFEERICGYPLNPGVEWENWPYGKSAARFLDGRGMFNHNYMERYWPKQAGHLQTPTYQESDYQAKLAASLEETLDPIPLNRGIMYDYGDLNDVINLLISDPFTRQAYLPIWFPEDTGGGNKRAPCTIGYHFMMREDALDINYHIRSCDFVRHFRDDLYLTIRLLLHVLDSCRLRDPSWEKVKPGKFYMQIGSLHIFRNDYQGLFKCK